MSNNIQKKISNRDKRNRVKRKAENIFVWILRIILFPITIYAYVSKYYREKHPKAKPVFNPNKARKCFTKVLIDGCDIDDDGTILLTNSFDDTLCYSRLFSYNEGKHKAAKRYLRSFWGNNILWKWLFNDYILEGYEKVKFNNREELNKYYPNYYLPYHNQSILFVPKFK